MGERGNFRLRRTPLRFLDVFYISLCLEIVLLISCGHVVSYTWNHYHNPNEHDMWGNLVVLIFFIRSLCFCDGFYTSWCLEMYVDG